MHNNPVYSSDKPSWVDKSIQDSQPKENPAIKSAEELFRKEVPKTLEHTVHVNHKDSK